MQQNGWTPHKKQAEFFALPLSIPEALYGGGVGSAKTETLLYYPIVHRWHELEGFKQLFLRRTFPELRNEVVPRSRMIYSKFGASFNKSDMVWTFPSGAMVFLGHCENEDDVHKYDSMQINLFTPDEITSFTEWMYLYISIERVRAKKGSGLPELTRAAGMPGGVGHTWVKNRFVKPCKEGGKIIIGKGGNKRIYIHATLADNPHISEKYAQQLEGLPEAEKLAKKYGSWDSYLGQVFEEFRDRKLPDEAENALHVIEPVAIPDWWPKILIGDWGFRAMTWFGWGAIAPTGRIYIYREQHWKKQKISEWAPFVKQFIQKENPVIIKVCKSAGQDRGQEHTIHQQLEDELECAVELTSNTPGSRIAGKLLIHEYLRWKPKPIIAEAVGFYDEEKAQWIARNKGEKEYKLYMQSFVPRVPEQNLPKLQIFNTCPVLIDAVKACVYDKNKIEDIAEFDGDDPVDGLRYLVDAADQYVGTAQKEFELVQQREALEKEYEKTRDWNAIYNKARALESRNTIKPVMRLHRGVRR